MIEYGTITQQTQYIAGKAVTGMPTYSESVRVSDSNEVLEIFKEMLAQRDRGLIQNPGVAVEEYSDTGKIKRVVKSWSVCEKTR